MFNCLNANIVVRIRIISKCLWCKSRINDLFIMEKRNFYNFRACSQRDSNSGLLKREYIASPVELTWHVSQTLFERQEVWSLQNPDRKCIQMCHKHVYKMRGYKIRQCTLENLITLYTLSDLNPFNFMNNFARDLQWLCKSRGNN